MRSHGVAALMAVVLAGCGSCERLHYTATVGGDVYAGVSKTVRCEVVQKGVVVSLHPYGEVWAFHAEAVGTAKVRCGVLGRLTTDVEVIEPTSLEVVCPDHVKLGEKLDCFARARDASGREISTDPHVEKWILSPQLEDAPPTGLCEFPPWCGTLGPASFRGKAVALGGARIEAEFRGVRGSKSVSVDP